MAGKQEAVLLPEICDAVLDAGNAGELNHQHKHISHIKAAAGWHYRMHALIDVAWFRA
jgi:hypothetical protein